MKNQGFTLAEMLVVVVIIGLMAIIAIPAFRNYYQAYQLRTSASQIINDLRAMRQRAVTKNLPIKVSFNKTTRTYGFYEYSSTDPPDPAHLKDSANWTKLTQPHFIDVTMPKIVRFHQDDPNKYIKDLDNDGNADVIFNQDGTIFNDGSFVFQQDKNNPLGNRPHIIVAIANNQIPNNAFVIYCNLMGSVGMVGFHHNGITEW